MIARRAHLALVRDIEPGAPEDALLLAREDRRIGVRGPVHRVLTHQRFGYSMHMHIVSQAVRTRQSEPADAYIIGRSTPYLLNRLAERMNAELREVLRPFRLTLRHWRGVFLPPPPTPGPVLAPAPRALIPP